MRVSCWKGDEMVPAVCRGSKADAPEFGQICPLHQLGAVDFASQMFLSRVKT